MLDGKQHHVLRGMVIAVAITGRCWRSAGFSHGRQCSRCRGWATRLGFALRCDLLVVIWLAAAVAGSGLTFYPNVLGLGLALLLLAMRE